MFGHSVASAGDVNGDGYADLVVGAPYRSTASLVFTGRASVYHGSASGVSAAAAWYVTGNQAEAHYGYSVSSAGDVNGDGYADVLVGAPGFDTTLDPTTYVDGGRVVLAFGGNGGLGSDLVNSDFYGTGGEQGRAVGPGGDVNGDGFAEVPLCTPGRRLRHRPGRAVEPQVRPHRAPAPARRRRLGAHPSPGCGGGRRRLHRRARHPHHLRPCLRPPPGRGQAASDSFTGAGLSSGRAGPIRAGSRRSSRTSPA